MIRDESEPVTTIIARNAAIVPEAFPINGTASNAVATGAPDAARVETSQRPTQAVDKPVYSNEPKARFRSEQSEYSCVDF